MRELAPHLVLDRLERSLAERPGVVVEPAEPARRAAVALILHTSAEALHILFIKRAEFERDPWSGQIALPGGRQEPSDASLVDTAIRETFEETGIDLHRDARLLGVLDELHPRTKVLPPIVVTPCVFALERDVEITPSPEVASSFWAPLEVLVDPANAHHAEVIVRGAPMRVPSFRHEGHIIWGMTHRILSGFFERVAVAAEKS